MIDEFHVDADAVSPVRWSLQSIGLRDHVSVTAVDDQGAVYMPSYDEVWDDDLLTEVRVSLGGQWSYPARIIIEKRPPLP